MLIYLMMTFALVSSSYFLPVMSLPAVVQDQAGETGVVDQANQALQMLHLIVRHLSYKQRESRRVKDMLSLFFPVFWVVLLKKA